MQIARVRASVVETQTELRVLTDHNLYIQIYCFTIKLPTDNGHNDVDVGTLDLCQERKYLFQDDHFVKTVQKTI